MTMRGAMPFLALVCACIAAGACSEPSVQDTFIRSDRTESGVYGFSIDLCDTLSCYDLYFYSSVAGTVPMENVRLDIEWVSPSGERASESVYFREISVDGSRELYRSAVVPEIAGTWRLEVRPDVGEASLTGLGLICIRKNGTRQT